MTHGILVPSKTAATDVDAWNRSAITTSDDVDNGWVVKLSTKSTTSGESEVWTALEPTTSNGLTGLWMAYSPEIVITESGSYEFKGIDPDPRNFTNLGAKVFDVFKPQLGDIITASADCLCGTYIANTTTHVTATNGTTGTSGGYTLLWANSASSTATCFKSIDAGSPKYFSIGTGAINNQRVTAYQLECVNL
jgi:hypothetical protein